VVHFVEHDVSESTSFSSDSQNAWNVLSVTSLPARPPPDDSHFISPAALSVNVKPRMFFPEQRSVAIPASAVCVP